jgi:hypothetical protein
VNPNSIDWLAALLVAEARLFVVDAGPRARP